MDVVRSAPYRESARPGARAALAAFRDGRVSEAIADALALLEGVRAGELAPLPARVGHDLALHAWAAGRRADASLLYETLRAGDESASFLDAEDPRSAWIAELASLPAELPAEIVSAVAEGLLDDDLELAAMSVRAYAEEHRAGAVLAAEDLRARAPQLHRVLGTSLDPDQSRHESPAADRAARSTVPPTVWAVTLLAICALAPIAPALAIRAWDSFHPLVRAEPPPPPEDMSEVGRALLADARLTFCDGPVSAGETLCGPAWVASSSAERGDCQSASLALADLSDQIESLDQAAPSRETRRARRSALAMLSAEIGVRCRAR